PTGDRNAPPSRPPAPTTAARGLVCCRRPRRSRRADANAPLARLATLANQAARTTADEAGLQIVAGMTALRKPRTALGRASSVGAHLARLAAKVATTAVGRI